MERSFKKGAKDMLFIHTGIRRIHFVGIGGAGMSGLAEVLKLLGFEITGSDIKKSEITQRLESLGIKVFYGHRKENINNPDLVVYSSAVPLSNIEIKEAKSKGIPVIRRAEMLSELTKIKFSICVTGAHGKSTTTTMISNLLKDAGLEPTFIVGGIVRGLDTGGVFGWGQFLVAEADESDKSFLQLFPSIGVITNIDKEHLDTYKTMKALKNAFKEFMLKIPFYGAIIYCGDDKNLRKLAQSIERKKISYGLKKSNDVYAYNINLKKVGSEFEVSIKGENIGKFEMNIPGLHNVYNALATISVAHFLRIPFYIVKRTLYEFKGVKRRFEFKGVKKGIGLIDDYAHHPTEIREFLKTARNFWEDGRLIVIFQPHRYSRTKLLWKEIAESLQGADVVVVLPIYPAGEKRIKGVSHKLIVDELRKKGVEVIDGEKNLKEKLMKIVREKDLICSVGAGNVYKIVEEVYNDILG
ncbi:MAG: UDP-N-acetylmuramate--L-alanine ligase [Candidatus Hydrothermales bacterium]